MRRKSAIPLLWLAAAVLSPIASAAAQTPPAVAPTPVRAERRVLLGVGLAYPMTLDHDVTIPLPSARLGVNISPRLVLELTAGFIAYEVSGRWTLIDVGLRWHLTDGSAVRTGVAGDVGYITDECARPFTGAFTICRRSSRRWR